MEILYLCLKRNLNSTAQVDKFCLGMQPIDNRMRLKCRYGEKNVTLQLRCTDFFRIFANRTFNPKNESIMKKILSMLMLLTMAAIFSSCYTTGSSYEPRGAERTETVQMKPFTAVEAAGALEVTIHQGASKSYVKLRGSDRALERTSMKVRDGKLYIEHKNPNGYNHDEVVVDVYCKRVTDLTAKAGAEVSTTDAIVNDRVELCASSGGELKVSRVTCATANLSASSGGDLDVASLKSSDGVKADASSGGSLDVDKLSAAMSTSITVSSGGSFESHITTAHLKAEASSGASIDLKGQASTGDFTASSGASIDADELTVNDLTANASSAGSITAKAIRAESHADLTGSVNITKVK